MRILYFSDMPEPSLCCGLWYLIDILVYLVQCTRAFYVETCRNSINMRFFINYVIIRDYSEYNLRIFMKIEI